MGTNEKIDYLTNWYELGLREGSANETLPDFGAMSPTMFREAYETGYYVGQAYLVGDKNER